MSFFGGPSSFSGAQPAAPAAPAQSPFGSPPPLSQPAVPPSGGFSNPFSSQPPQQGAPTQPQNPTNFQQAGQDVGSSFAPPTTPTNTTPTSAMTPPAAAPQQTPTAQTPASQSSLSQLIGHIMGTAPVQGTPVASQAPPMASAPATSHTPPNGTAPTLGGLINGVMSGGGTPTPAPVPPNQGTAQQLQGGQLPPGHPGSAAAPNTMSNGPNQIPGYNVHNTQPGAPRAL